MFDRGSCVYYATPAISCLDCIPLPHLLHNSLGCHGNALTLPSTPVSLSVFPLSPSLHTHTHTHTHSLTHSLSLSLSLSLPTLIWYYKRLPHPRCIVPKFFESYQFTVVIWQKGIPCSPHYSLLWVLLIAVLASCGVDHYDQASWKRQLV